MGIFDIIDVFKLLIINELRFGIRLVILRKTYVDEKIKSLQTPVLTLLFLITSFSSFAGTGVPVTDGNGDSPVSVTTFDARPLRKIVELTWSTTRETNVNHFILQRSIGGKIYSEIAVITSGENSSATKAYKYTDDRAVRGRMPVYYRLKSVDRDGQDTYSAVKIISKERIAELVY